jgi:hypothetical protein
VWPRAQVRNRIRIKNRGQGLRGIDSVVEPLPSICEALGSIPSTIKIKIKIKNTDIRVRTEVMLNFRSELDSGEEAKVSFRIRITIEMKVGSRVRTGLWIKG